MSMMTKPNGFRCFIAHLREETRRQQGSYDHDEVSKRADKEWRALNSDEKMGWKQKAITYLENNPPRMNQERRPKPKKTRKYRLGEEETPRKSLWCYAGASSDDRFRRKCQVERDALLYELVWKYTDVPKETLLDVEYPMLVVETWTEVDASEHWAPGDEAALAIPSEIIFCLFKFGSGLVSGKTKHWLVGVDETVDNVAAARLREPNSPALPFLIQPGQGPLRYRPEFSHPYDVLKELISLTENHGHLYIQRDAYNVTLGAMHWLNSVARAGKVKTSRFEPNDFAILDDLAVCANAFFNDFTTVSACVAEAVEPEDIALPVMASDLCSTHADNGLIDPADSVCVLPTAQRLVAAARKLAGLPVHIPSRAEPAAALILPRQPPIPEPEPAKPELPAAPFTALTSPMEHSGSSSTTDVAQRPPLFDAVLAVNTMSCENGELVENEPEKPPGHCRTIGIGTELSVAPQASGICTYREHQPAGLVLPGTVTPTPTPCSGASPLSLSGFSNLSVGLGRGKRHFTTATHL